MSPPTMNVSSSAGPRPCSASQQVDRVRRAVAVGVRARDAEPRVARHRGLAHRDPVLDARLGLDLLVRRHARRHEQHPVEPELRRSASCAQTRCAMCGGLKVPPSRPTRATRYSRTWPVPSTRYLNVHSSRRPIGPRACSFWVELPISAPIPNSPPSVKRVEALT